MLSLVSVNCLDRDPFTQSGHVTRIVKMIFTTKILEKTQEIILLRVSDGCRDDTGSDWTYIISHTAARGSREFPCESVTF